MSRQVVGSNEVVVAQPSREIVDREVDDFLSRVYRLDLDGDTRAATDKVFDYIDRLLVSGMFGICDEILERVDVEKLSTALIRSFLTITFAAKDRLNARAGFFARAEREMMGRRGPEVTQRLLSRLV